MRNLLALFLATTAVAASADVFGPTVAVYNGFLGGTVGAHAKCQAEYGPTARFCTTRDIQYSYGAALFDGTPSWVNPTDIEAANDTWTDTAGGDYVGIHADLNCGKWGTSGGRRGIITGPSSLGNCAVARPLACCE